MSKQKVGEVTTPSAHRGTTYPVFWDSSTHEVFVGKEPAGKASSASDALHVGDYYASTKIKKEM